MTHKCSKIKIRSKKSEPTFKFLSTKDYIEARRTKIHKKSYSEIDKNNHGPIAYYLYIFTHAARINNISFSDAHIEITT